MSMIGWLAAMMKKGMSNQEDSQEESHAKR
jgi:hypothetical protein